MSKDPVYQALQKWITLTGIVPDADNISFGSDYDIKRCNDDLRETQEQDETGITTVMLLRSFMQNFTDNVEFTLTELVESPKESHDMITKVVDLTAELVSPAIRDRVTTFQSTLRDAVKHYGFDNKKVQKLIDDEYSLAYVRRDAKRAFSELTEYQFLQGEEDIEEAKYNPNVHEFWNVNSMLEICKRAENGISVCLVRDPMGEASFFVLMCKNGSVITILTDRPEWEHPEQKYMTRRPGRELGKRMYRLRFPYDLLGIEEDARGDKYVKKQVGELVLYQTETIPASKIADLKADEIIWLVLMFDQMQDKYWKQRYRTAQLGYTAEMIVESDRILEGIADLAVVEGYERIQVPVLATEDVTVESTFDQWLDEPTRANGWMEERYGDRVPASVLNAIGKDRPALPFTGMTKVAKTELAKNLSAMEPTWFGSKEELVKDRMWVARFNKAKVVGALADEEFKKRKNEIEKWYEKKVKANFQAILMAMIRKEFITTRQCEKATFDLSGEEQGNILRFRDFATEENGSHAWMSLSGMAQLVLAGNYVRKRDGFRCYICKDRVSSLLWKLRPTTAKAIADIAGVAVEELPDVIQNWRDEDPYGGNPILARIDPMDWSIEDPWKELDFEVTIRTCKRCLKAHAKSMGLKFVADGPAKAE